MKILANNCLLIKGAKMNLLIDIQNRCWYHINESEEDLLSDKLNNNMKKYLKDNGILLEIPEFLLERLPKLDRHYYSPQEKESIIIDINEFSQHTVPQVLSYLDQFNPVNLQVRYFCKPTISSLKETIEYLDNTTLEAVEFIIPFDELIFNFLIKDHYIETISKVFRVFFHSVDQTTFKKPEFDFQKIYFTTQNITNESCCGNINAYNFSNNPKHSLKSMNFNSCLYKKIGIDTKGNIKNCPSLNETYGTVFDTNSEKSGNISFRTEHIKKDDIEVCRDCEFRYVCTDCRAYTDSKSRNNARPSKCDYNPYIAKWSHEEGYRTLSESGVISNEHEFSIDHERIAEINNELWGE